MENKPIKCWYCKYLGKCQVLVPCSKYRPYNYNSCTLTEIAKQCGVSIRTLFRWLDTSEDYAINKVYEKTGIEYDIIRIKEKRKFKVKQQ